MALRRRAAVCLVAGALATLVGAGAQEPQNRRVLLGQPAALPAASGPADAYLVVTRGGVLYSEPSTSASRLGAVAADDVLHVSQRRSDGWTQVLWEDRRAWVFEAVAVDSGSRVWSGGERLSDEPSQRLWRRALAQRLDWRQEQVGNFEVLSDLEARAESQLEIERLLTCLPSELAGRLGARPQREHHQGAEPPRPAHRVVLFSDLDAYQRFVEDVAGTRDSVLHAPDELVAVFFDDLEIRHSLATLAGEVVHMLLRRWHPAPLPPWLEEGLVEDHAWSVAARGACGGLGRFPLSQERVTDVRTETRQRPGGNGEVQFRVTRVRRSIAGQQIDLGCAWALWQRGEVGLAELLELPSAYLRDHEHRLPYRTLAAVAVRYLLDGPSAASRNDLQSYLRLHRSGGGESPLTLTQSLGGRGLRPFEERVRRWGETQLLPSAVPCPTSAIDSD